LLVIFVKTHIEELVIVLVLR